MGRYKLPVDKRFWSQVAKKGPDDCWEWLGSKAGKYREYGRMKFGDRVEGAHRVSWILHNGPIPDGLDVLHKCDNAGCVNPAHLWLGTHTDNMRDKMRKGRGGHQIGEVNHAAKLTEQDVLEIREWLKQGMSQREAARRKGVSSVAISYINTRTTWRHI